MDKNHHAIDFVKKECIRRGKLLRAIEQSRNTDKLEYTEALRICEFNISVAQKMFPDIVGKKFK